MRVLITGATGFIGHELVKKIKDTQEIACIVRKENQFLKDNKIKTIVCNLNNIDELLKKTKNFEVVIHLAGIVNTHSKKEFYNKNVELTKNLLNVCKKNKIKKFIFISTAVVASEVQGNYSKSKIEAENLVKQSGVDYVILRPSLVYGKEDKKNLSGIIKIIKKYPVFPLIGGSSKLQPIHVDDVVDIIIQSIKNKKANNKTYFVAGPEEIIFKRVIKILSAKLNKKVLMVPIPPFIPIFLVKVYEKLSKNPAIVNEQMARLMTNNVCDISETKKDFNFNPLTFKEGVNKLF